MASVIGKIQAALAVATQETTLALANFNFDFSLVKVDAPVEFHGLGSALSTKRRNASESGDHHRTARKLGSLFENMLPDTPNLFKAYGLRVSEIANSPSAMGKGTKSYGPFADYAGVDGTNIWAAATSGNAAIAVHLLACMLARIWKASEAIGVWEQIVAARKQELATFDETGSIHIQSLVSSQLTLSRSQLSEWDASARSWLRTADEARVFNQKQLMLIVENINDLPVNKNMDVYLSVMEAWRTAMITLDKVVSGMSHSIHEGSVLLGLAAWHIYPDLVVLGSNSTEVKQNDPLVYTGGVITIGLQGIHPESTGGVYWSLPLAYVRYYGDPVQAEGSINSDSPHVPLDQFLVVILGELCMHWGVRGPEVKEAAKLIRAAWKCFVRGLDKFPLLPNKSRTRQTHWLRIMNDAAAQFLQSKGTDQESCRRLIALGQKRCCILGRNSKYIIPIMGFRIDSYVTMLDHSEGKVSFLRRVVAQCDAALDSLIIRAQVTLPGNLKSYEYLTARPRLSSEFSSDLEDQWVFIRWVAKNTVDPAKLDWLQRNGEIVIELSNEAVDDDFEPVHDASWFRWHNPPSFFLDPPTASEEIELDEEDDESPRGLLSRWNPFARRSAETTAAQKTVITFQPLIGDPQTAAVFKRVDRPDIEFFEDSVSLGEISAAFQNDQISPEKFVRHLAKYQTMAKIELPTLEGDVDPEPEVLASLKSLELATMVFKQLPSATISLHVISYMAMASTLWSMASDPPLIENSDIEFDTSLQPLLPKLLSRQATFSCIAFFESGGLNIDPASLTRVMAMSSENSIFVAAPLLCDPAIEPESHAIQRIIGNVGRSGIAFLYPPDNPKTKEWDLGFYQVVRHEEFDGRLDDCFQSTTMHLAFSGYESPIDIGVHGGRFTEAFFLETIVSLHDRGEWIADLDVLSTFDSHMFYSLVDQPECKDRAPIPIPNFSVVAIDSWKELIDQPLQVAVLRAHGNWLARLAAASLSVRLGIPTVVFGKSCCWSCGEKMLAQLQNSGSYTGRVGNNGTTNVVFVI